MLRRGAASAPDHRPGNPPPPGAWCTGDPAVALLAAAEDGDHLVVGAVHEGLWRRVTEGSVSALRVRNSPVPVTVVPWPARIAGPPPARSHGAARPMAVLVP